MNPPPLLTFNYGRDTLALGVSEETVGLDWRMAKAWLARELSKGGGRAAHAG